MNFKDYLLGAWLVAVLIVGVLYVNKPVNVNVQLPEVNQPVGASSGNEHYNTEIFYNSQIVGSGNVKILKKNCNSVSVVYPSLAGGASTTVSVPLTGVSTSTYQAYFANVATSTIVGPLGTILKASANASSGPNALNINVLAAGVTWSGGVATTTACLEEWTP